ncbi:hypothetical protein [Nonomuraea sp. NPDC049158]|uniref:hypothetical protein n=1 Tax=Nonomuraea sp. NPDC049158 TaxID=3155649 RepID=UPI0034083E7C
MTTAPRDAYGPVESIRHSFWHSPNGKGLWLNPGPSRHACACPTPPSPWDHADTEVALTKGEHVLTLAAKSLDGTRATKGDALVDKIDLSLANRAAAETIYEAEYATLKGASTDYSRKRGHATIGKDQTATFWAYSPDDGESTLTVDKIAVTRLAKP